MLAATRWPLCGVHVSIIEITSVQLNHQRYRKQSDPRPCGEGMRALLGMWGRDLVPGLHSSQHDTRICSNGVRVWVYGLRSGSSAGIVSRMGINWDLRSGKGRRVVVKLT